MRREYNASLVVLACGVMGVIVAMILKNLYEKGIVVQELLAGTLTIDQLMFASVLSWLLIGVVIALRK